MRHPLSRFFAIAFLWAMVAPVEAQVAFQYDLPGNLTAQSNVVAVARPAFQQFYPQYMGADSNGVLAISAPVTGVGGFTYQWLFDGGVVGGATNDSFLLTDATAGNLGNYQLIASNSAGAVTSAVINVSYFDPDGSGLPVAWEMRYFGATGVNPDADADGDGVSNYGEYIDGTDPTNSRSLMPRLYIIPASGGVVNAVPLEPEYTMSNTVQLTAVPNASWAFGSLTITNTGSSTISTNTNRVVNLLMDACKTVIPLFNPLYNSWTNASGGKWETAGDWSFGAAPLVTDLGDFLTNANTKSVTIDAVTTGTPSALTINYLTVSAPSGSTNTLFLNNAGTATPLQILTSLTVGTGGVVFVSNSGLVAGLATNAGLIEATTGTVTISRMDNAWTASASATNVPPLNTGVLLMNGGMLTVADTDTDTQNVARAIQNNGTILGSGTLAASVIQPASGFTVASNGVLNIYGNFASGQAVYAPSNGQYGSYLAVTGGELKVTGPITTQGGFWAVHAGGLLEIATNVTASLSNAYLPSANVQGTVLVDPGAALTLSSTNAGGPFYTLVGTLDINGGIISMPNTGGLTNFTNTATGLITGSGTFQTGYGTNQFNYAIVNFGMISAASGDTLTLLPQDAFNFGGVQNGSNGTMMVDTGGTLVIRRTDNAWYNSGAKFPTNAGTVYLQDGTLRGEDTGGSGVASLYVNGSTGLIEGCGTVQNFVTVQNNGTILSDCGGTLTFSGIVTNYGTMRAIANSTLEAYGTVVNNGTIDITAGKTNFHAAFINNGTILGGPAPPIFQISSIVKQGNNILLTWTTFGGTTNVVQVASSAAGGGYSNNFLDLSPMIGVPLGVTSTNYTDIGGATNGPTRYYRIALVAPPPSDNAADPAYSGGWTNGSNGGTGFSPWTMSPSTNSSNTGFFIGNATENGTIPSGGGINTTNASSTPVSWGLYGNTNNNLSVTAAAYRSFTDGPLNVGDTFSIGMDNGYVLTTTPGVVGFVLRSGNVTTNKNFGERFEFLFIGGKTNYNIVTNSVQPLIDTGIRYTDGGVIVNFTLTGVDSFSCTVTALVSGASTNISGTLGGQAGSEINSISLYNQQDGFGPNYNLYFNRMSIIPSGGP